ncbi:MAG: hypothetical protein QNJ90_04490 [Planctomycetota bacterium]|nr:hypothetical protein [Planctomycetota bacterium]
MRRSLLLFSFALLLGGAPVAADSPWKAVRLKAAEPGELDDLQSPLFATEMRVRGAEPVRIGGERFVLEPGPEAGRGRWTRIDSNSKKDKRTRTGTFRVPGTLTLSTAIDGPYHLMVRAEEGGWVLRSRMGMRVPVGRVFGYLLDCDLDGELGSSGDGYVAPMSRTVGPWSGEAWHLLEGRRYRKDDQGGWEHAPVELPHPADRDHSRTWCLLQWTRQQCGCLPLGYDASLEDGMRKHAAYLARHGGEAHAEDPAKPGYTPEGERAAKSSIIGHGDTSMFSAMKMHLATMYHRTRPLQPGLMRTAMVFHQGTFLFDVFTHRGGPQKDALLVFPPHGAANVRVRFHEQGESPMPVVGVPADGNRLGTAVNVFSEPLRTATKLASRPRLTLRRDGRRTRPLEGRLQYPGHAPSARAGISNRGSVAFIPVAPLRSRSRYRAEARIVLPGGAVFDYRWWFETGRAASRRAR